MMIDPKTFADSTLQLLQQDPRRYRNFGVYWYLAKGVLRHFYTRDNLHILGDYMDQGVIERMPPHASLGEALQAAAAEYAQNASFNLGRSQVEAPDGEVFTLIDTDAAVGMGDAFVTREAVYTTPAPIGARAAPPPPEPELRKSEAPAPRQAIDLDAKRKRVAGLRALVGKLQK